MARPLMQRILLPAIVLTVPGLLFLSPGTAGDRPSRMAAASAAPVITAGTTSVSPGSVDRFGPATTTISVTFTDADSPGVDSFLVTFQVRSQYNALIYTIADTLRNGQGGLTIVDDGGGQYTASMPWDPPDNTELGYYDLRSVVSDGTTQAVDDFANNPDELLISNGGENAPPVVASDATYASPGAIERVGAIVTNIAATFSDADAPPVTDFRVTFKLRLPDDQTELVLADNAADGTAGVSITDQGGGVYSASVGWDPPDAQAVGTYDLYFHVTDGIDTSYDKFSNNLDELEIYDAAINTAPTIVAGTTLVVPDSITRVGSEFTTIRTVFSDSDMPGRGAFLVTMKVRDQSAAEYTVVSGAAHGQQGLRIRHLSGPDYEASVLWDPPETQATGTYDLYVMVQDDGGATAVDDYANNPDELTVSSSAIPGDGYLLRRTHDDATCGGPNAACHNVTGHQGQGCLTCHTSHATTNIYLIRDTIQTPNSGPREVIFKTLGIGDPYNDPDPVPGDPNSGVMADATDGVYTGVCEVCHTSTSQHRNDGSAPNTDHHNADDCTQCHSHQNGFEAGESAGGQSCSCHNSIFQTMDSTALFYRHILANTDANYTPGASGMYTIKNCLTCHVDHDIFRPDLNTGVGQRGKNLRVDWQTDPVQGTDTVLANSDYSAVGNGGICLSCHSGPGCDGCHSAHLASSRLPSASAGSYSHVFIPKADYDAATSAHNYSVPSTFGADGSAFNANCSKCHNDSQAKSYQAGLPAFSVHGSDYDNLLDSTGIASPADPLEEEFCFKCHSTTSNPNAGSGLDYYGVQSMTNADALDLEAAFSRTYTHPTLTFSGRHSMADSAASFGDANRHAECTDCHNPHAARQGTHDGTTHLVSNALTGAWGVEPSSWPAAPDPTDNANVFAAPAGYTKVDPVEKEYQLCLKCHSNYTTLPTGKRNLAEEINPNYPSTHALVQAGTNPYCNSTTMNEPWGTNKLAWCSDCHRSSDPADPEGPHGSNMEHLLVATVVSDNMNGTPLCLVCHKSSVYWSGSASASRFGDHPSSKGAHKRSQGCFACHMWDYSSTAGLGVSTTNWSGGNPPPGIFVHGQNKKWVYNEQDGSAGTGQPVDAFVNGYIANMDYTNRRCWTETCKDHSNKGY